MNISVSQELVGIRVAIETHTQKLEGLVRSVDSKGSKISLADAIIIPSNVKIPSLYHVFVKDIQSSKSHSQTEFM